MKLSVIIPCYNERATIEAVVDSVRLAPVEDIEIIVVDDGSTDGTRELLKAKPHGWVNKIVLQEQLLATWSSFKTRTWSMIQKNTRSFLHRFWRIVPTLCLAPGFWAAGLIAWFTSGIWWATGF